MFNDLNQAANQPRPAVDDIFAETDRPVAASATTAPQQNVGSSSIQAHRVGLASEEGGEPMPTEKTGAPWFKITVIAIIVIILALGAYLVYSKFMTPAEPALAPLDMSPATSTDNSVGTFVPTTTPDSEVPLIPGVNAPAEETPTTTPVVVIPPAPLDSDQDGLTDDEEAVAGTNINIMDTDADELSDYEEVRIYGTNPVVADTDGDGYPDGNEIKNGYDPKGPGKLQAN